MPNTILNQPTVASLLTTDYLLAWQNSQSPSTRKLPISGLAGFYATLSGAAFTGSVSATVSTGNWSSFNVGKQLLVATSGGANNPGIGITDTNGVNLWGIWNSSGVLYFGGMPAYNNSSTAPSIAMSLSTTGTGGSVPQSFRGYLGGLVLAFNTTTLLSIGAGVCIDSTNTTAMTLTAFTKSISGSWTAGTGQNGMGQGLTATASTWYHVFAIINNGDPDVYFDTSITADNKPASTTAFRRIGSIFVNSSTHIESFSQLGDKFIWTTDFIGAPGSIGTTAATLNVAVPPGLVVEAILRISISNAGGAVTFLASYLGQTDQSAATTFNIATANTATNAAELFVPTNTSGQIRIRASSGSTSYKVNTVGYIDTRGRFD